MMVIMMMMVMMVMIEVIDRDQFDGGDKSDWSWSSAITEKR